MKPVAWWITYRDDDGIPQLQVLPHPVHPDSPLAKRGGVAQEPLYTADLIERLAARVPDGCVVVGYLDGRDRFFYADDPLYKNNHEGMREVLTAGEVKP